MDFTEVLDNWRSGLPSAKKDQINAVISGSLPCFVLGLNIHSQFIARHVELAGFIDDQAGAGSIWQGRPVIRGDEIPSNVVVINAVLHKRPQQALRRLQQLPNTPIVLHYSDFMRHQPDRFPPLPHIEQAQQAFFANRDAFSALGQAFADAESRHVLRDIMLYRMTGDPVFTQSYKLREMDQYFDVPLGLPDSPVFLDGGAYCGETTEMFCKLFPKFAHVHLFEPNPVSFARARALLGNCPNITFYPNAIGREHVELLFDATAANASRIVEDGSSRVEVLAIDEAITGPINMIKLDVEGFEVDALVGARRIIETQKPTLAVCVYHHPKDFVEVPRIVLEACPNYRIRLRHYTEGWEESVMYFTNT